MSQFWRSLTIPPYRSLPWLIWAYAVTCFFVQSQGGVFTGHILGYDDQVRMTQVLNWINGAGFYDRTITRANPPEGFTTIWSRIVDIPIAFVVLIAQQFVEQRKAALVAATIVPMGELAFLLTVAGPYFVRPLVGKKRANLVGLFLIFTSILNLKSFSASGFFVGQASHHPWYVILDLTMFGAAARLALGSLSLSPILILACSIALLTAVGIESYPMIAIAVSLLAMISWLYNRPQIVARSGDALICATLGSLFLLPMHEPMLKLFTVSFAEPSILGVILIATAALFLKTEQLLLNSFPKKRLVSGVLLFLLALLLALLLIYAFPAILDGPAAGLSPAERKMALSQHVEALSVYKNARNGWEFLNLIMPSLIALIAGLYAIYRSYGRRRMLHICYFGFAAFGCFMSEVYSRYYHHALTTACAWLLWLWEKIKVTLRENKNYNLSALASFILIGPLFMLLLPAIEYDAPIKSQVLFFPSAIQTVIDQCDSLPFANYINAHYNFKTLLIVPSWESEQILYQTNIRIDFVSNYPSHDKFIDNFNFFATTDPEIARKIAYNHKLDLVAVCRVPPAYDRRAHNDGLPLLALLQKGTVPKWLKPINTGLETNYNLYEIDKTALIEGGH